MRKMSKVHVKPDTYIRRIERLLALNLLAVSDISTHLSLEEREELLIVAGFDLRERARILKTTPQTLVVAKHRRARETERNE